MPTEEIGEILADCQRQLRFEDGDWVEDFYHIPTGVVYRRRGSTLLAVAA